MMYGHCTRVLTPCQNQVEVCNRGNQGADASLFLSQSSGSVLSAALIQKRGNDFCGECVMVFLKKKKKRTLNADLVK